MRKLVKVLILYPPTCIEPIVLTPIESIQQPDPVSTSLYIYGLGNLANNCSKIHNSISTDYRICSHEILKWMYKISTLDKVSCH